MPRKTYYMATTQGPCAIENAKPMRLKVGNKPVLFVEHDYNLTHAASGFKIFDMKARAVQCYAQRGYIPNKRKLAQFMLDDLVNIHGSSTVLLKLKTTPKLKDLKK